jgi:hypothetical protein
MDLSNVLSASSVGLSSVTPSTPTPSNISNSVNAAIPASISGIVSSNSATMSPSASQTANNYIPNFLSSFASYTALWTLAALSINDANDPTSYRSSGILQNIVLSSAGRFDNERVSTANGKPEFFINNVVIKHSISPTKRTGQSDVSTLTFEVHEPYSLGEFQQCLSAAAIQAGHPVVNQCPFVLKLEFQGYDENGQSVSNPIMPKYFVIQISTMEFTASEAGSVYKVSSLPDGHYALSSMINTLYKDIKLTTENKSTVQDILSGSLDGSLITVLNEIELEELKNRRKSIPDQYEINFPPISPAPPSNPGAGSATLNVGAASSGISVGTNSSSSSSSGTNPIGLSSLNLTVDTGGNQKFASALQAIDPTGYVDPSKISIDPTAKVMQFLKGMQLTEVITQIIIHSQYVIDAATDTSKYVNGYIPYFKIIPSTKRLCMDSTTGKYAMKYIYDVVQYYVHESKNTNGTAASNYTSVKSKICKAYDYMYTGKNTEVLKFNLQFNNMYGKIVSPSPEQKNSQNESELQGTTAKEKQSAAVSTGAATAILASNMPIAAPMRDPNLISNMTNPSGTTDTVTKIAQTFYKTLLDGATDMTLLDLEILGDPYWLSQTGMGNYVSRADPSKLITNDGEMNYTVSSIHIQVNFRSPVDINENTGLYDFPSGTVNASFSGIYEVDTAESTFNDGMFKQKLVGKRVPGQPEDFPSNVKPPVGIKQENILVQPGLMLKIPPSVFDIDVAVGLPTNNSASSSSSSPATPLTSTTTA